MPVSVSLAGLATAVAYLGQTGTTQAEPAQNPNVFNPQIVLVTDFRATLTRVAGEPGKAEVKELELGLAADVDPFVRGEAYIAVAQEEGETHVEVEEAFGRFTNLGKGFQAKLGKIAGAIGRIQRNHTDQLNFLDYPFVIQDMLGDHGLRAPGASISYLFPTAQFNELTAEALVPDDGPLFEGASTERPVGIGRFRTFFDFTEDLSAQLGASFAVGPNGSATATMYGLDYTMKWRPGVKGKSAVFEAEAYWADTGVAGERTVFGAFGSLEFEVMPRWFVTAKVDYSEIPGTTDIRRGYGVNLTYRISEFQHLRLEFQRITSNFEDDRNVLTLQFQYLIGVHPAHKY